MKRIIDLIILVKDAFHSYEIFSQYDEQNEEMFQGIIQYRLVSKRVYI